MLNSRLLDHRLALLIGFLSGLIIATIIFIDDNEHFLRQLIGSFDESFVYWGFFGLGFISSTLAALVALTKRGQDTNYGRSVLFQMILALCYFAALILVATVERGRLMSFGMILEPLRNFMGAAILWSLVVAIFFKRTRSPIGIIGEKDILDNWDDRDLD